MPCESERNYFQKPVRFSLTPCDMRYNMGKQSEKATPSARVVGRKADGSQVSASVCSSIRRPRCRIQVSCMRRQPMKRGSIVLTKHGGMILR
jgi:hypothetical protein